MNFNIVKKPSNNDDDVKVEINDDYEADLDGEADDININIKSNNGYDPKKKMFRFMGIIVGIVVVLLLILFIASLGGKNKSKTYSYSEIEKIMEKAAKSYFKDHPDYLPDESSIIEVDVDSLVNEGKMKDLSQYTKDDISCTGNVQVQKEDDEYIYTPNLNCGDNYSTIPLYSKVLEKNDVVNSGYGLYHNNNGYVFRGENINNYVQLDNSLWRIVKITSNNNIVLINEEGAGYSNPWDNRYNEERKYESGINNYASSRAKEFLEKIYKNPDEDDKEDVLSKKDKTRLVEYNVCIGKRTLTSEGKDNSYECRETLKNQKMGLLTLSDFLYASVDPNCKSADTKSCKNYNYLVIKSNWWLGTANSDDTSTVFKVGANGVITADNASNYALLRPVIYLNDTVMYKSGKGTLEKPYTVR